MRVAYVSFYADETTIFFSEDFNSLDNLSKLDILRDMKYWVDSHYSDQLKIWRDRTKQKANERKKKTHDRIMLAYELRHNKKMTYKKIGEELGVSSTRAQQIVRHAERKKERQKRWG
jgi:DNA-directed RNA polymerase specialized sigma subunit